MLEWPNESPPPQLRVRVADCAQELGIEELKSTTRSEKR